MTTNRNQSISAPPDWEHHPVFTYHKGNTPYLTLNNLSTLPGILHGFSTRWGGVSEGIYANMNLGFKTADALENIRENHKIICSAIGLTAENLTLTDQTHSTNVKVVRESDIGKGFISPQDYHDIDGLVTNLPHVPLSVVHADCVPLLFADPVQKVVGAAHAGWRGTMGNIAANMIQVFIDHFHSDPQNIYMGIGPSIGFCCYEVDQPVADMFLAHPLLADSTAIKPTLPGKYHINLQLVNNLIARKAGVRPEHITDIGLCTNCHKDIFFSHRGHQGKRGLLASLIELTE